MDNIVRNKFAQRLKELRLESGLTRQQPADQLNVSVRLLSYWENGQRECNFDTLLMLSKILDSPIDYLLGNTEN